MGKAEIYMIIPDALFSAVDCRYSSAFPAESKVPSPLFVRVCTTPDAGTA